MLHRQNRRKPNLHWHQQFQNIDAQISTKCPKTNEIAQIGNTSIEKQTQHKKTCKALPSKLMFEIISSSKRVGNRISRI